MIKYILQRPSFSFRLNVMEKEFRKLYDTHARYVYNIALRTLNNRIDAQDITQEVFIRLRDNLEAFKGEADIKTYIYRITVNKCVDFIRHERSQNNRIEKSAVHRSSEIKINDLVLESILQVLPPRQRAVVMLFELCGFSQKEIAEMTGVKEGTIKSQICRSIKKMAEYAAGAAYE